MGGCASSSNVVHPTGNEVEKVNPRSIPPASSAMSEANEDTSDEWEISRPKRGGLVNGNGKDGNNGGTGQSNSENGTGLDGLAKTKMAKYEIVNGKQTGLFVGEKMLVIHTSPVSCVRACARVCLRLYALSFSWSCPSHFLCSHT